MYTSMINYYLKFFYFLFPENTQDRGEILQKKKKILEEHEEK